MPARLNARVARLKARPSRSPKPMAPPAALNMAHPNHRAALKFRNSRNINQSIP